MSPATNAQVALNAAALCSPKGTFSESHRVTLDRAAEFLKWLDDNSPPAMKSPRS